MVVDNNNFNVPIKERIGFACMVFVGGTSVVTLLRTTSVLSLLSPTLLATVTMLVALIMVARFLSKRKPDFATALKNVKDHRALLETNFHPKTLKKNVCVNTKMRTYIAYDKMYNLMKKSLNITHSIFWRAKDLPKLIRSLKEFFILFKERMRAKGYRLNSSPDIYYFNNARFSLQALNTIIDGLEKALKELDASHQ